MMMRACSEDICNPTRDAERMHAALENEEMDENQIINIVGRRPNNHLQKVKEEYQRLFNEDLVKNLRMKTKNKHLSNLLKYLMKDINSLKGDSIYKSLKFNRRGVFPLINFIIGNTEPQIEETKRYIREKYDVELIDLLHKHLMGNFEKIMAKILEEKRMRGVEEDKVQRDKNLIINKEKNKLWEQDDVLNIFALRSPQHISNVSSSLLRDHNKKLSDIIDTSLPNDLYFKSAVLGCMESTELFWAKKIKHGFESYLCNDYLLNISFTNCDKIFLQRVDSEYLRSFGVSLTDDVIKYTSEGYRDLLLTLLDLSESEYYHYQN